MRTLFVGKGRTAVCWYRCALPAIYLDQDWCGVSRDPDAGLRFLTGGMRLPMEQASLAGYDAVVLQQVHGEGWPAFIRDLRRRGVTVLYEIDDDVHAVRKKDDHVFAEHFGRDVVRDYERAMGSCDGIITTTDFLAERVARFNPRVWVCPNGLDLGRYALTRPPRETVTIGWSGATGHANAVLPWLREVDAVMAEHPATRFVSVGQPFAELLRARHGEARALDVPWAGLETYPASMSMFDIALAPAGRSNFYRAKSDLRFVEAGALGIPVIADPVVYPTIEDGVTGFHAETPAEAGALLRALVDDEAVRARVGEAARAYVHRERDMRVASERWRTALAEARGVPATL